MGAGMHNVQPGVKVEAHSAGGTGELAGLPLQELAGTPKKCSCRASDEEREGKGE